MLVVFCSKFSDFDQSLSLSIFGFIYTLGPHFGFETLESKNVPELKLFSFRLPHWLLYFIKIPRWVTSFQVWQRRVPGNISNLKRKNTKVPQLCETR